jgi:hypothetical protein
VVNQRGQFEFTSQSIVRLYRRGAGVKRLSGLAVEFDSAETLRKTGSYR